MSGKWKKRLIKWVKVLLVVYILGGLGLYFFQDYILFHPVTLKKNHRYDFKEPHTDINIPVDDESNLNVVQFLSRDTIRKGVVLYFHGNKKNISWYEKYTSFFTKQGYELIMIDYPGFGKSTGKLTEETLYKWSEIVYRFARSKYAADSIIIYGKSMGTGLAAYLASKEECKELVLETPYYDYPSVVKHYLPMYPVYSMLHYQIPTHQYIKRVSAPILIFHGTSDGVVTYSNSERLKPLLKPGDKLVTVKGGSHNDLFDYEETVNSIDSLLKGN